MPRSRPLLPSCAPCFLALLGFTALFAKSPGPEVLTLSFTRFATNAAGLEITLLELYNQSADSTIEPQLLIVNDEEYSAIAPTPPKYFVTSYSENAERRSINDNRPKEG